MVKTLASIAVIVVALGMAVGLKYVGDRNRAISVVNNDQLSVDNEVEENRGVEKENIFLEVASEGNVVMGKTEPMAEVMVNDIELKADEDGNFSTKISLDEGENEIMVTVNDEEGNFMEKTIMITYEPTN